MSLGRGRFPGAFRARAVGASETVGGYGPLPHP